MPLLNLNLATLGMDTWSKLRVLRRHAQAFIGHMTARRLLNFLRTEYNRLRKKEFLDSFPYILKIESTNICNLRCAYCYDDRCPPGPGQRPYGRMTLDQFKRLVDEVGPYLFKINLYGFGEPFLFPETLEMIRYASDRNIGVGVSSNMNYHDPDLARRIVESGLEVLIFSCHGLTQETYSRFMGKGDMELALANLGQVIEARRQAGSKTLFIDWQFCVTGFNQHQVKLVQDKARQMGVDQIRFIPPLFPPEAPPQWQSDLFPPRDQAPAPLGCSWVYRSAYINFDGGLLPCCRDVRETANDFGNVLDQGFAAVWNNPAYASSRRLIADPQGSRGQCQTMCAACPSLGLGGRPPKRNQIPSP